MTIDPKLVTTKREGRLLLGRLREETHAQHEALDASVGGQLTRSREDYARFLRGSLAAVGPIEAAIAGVLGEGFRPERVDRLRADLVALGFDPDRVRPVDLPPVDASSEAPAFGAAYVVEGSALGGVVLADRVEASLGASDAISYLRLRGPGTGARWKWFMSELDAFAKRVDLAAHDETVAAAKAVFDRYRLALAAFAAHPA